VSAAARAPDGNDPSADQAVAEVEIRADGRGADSSPDASVGTVIAGGGHRSGTNVTRDLIERIARGAPGARLRSQVTGWHPGVTGEQVEEAFQEACVRACRSCRGQSEGEVFTWLRTTTHRELWRLQKPPWPRSQPESLVDVHACEVGPAVCTVRTPEDDLIARDDRAELERVTGAVLARLSERQREIAVLHSHGRSRSEIAERVGVTPRTVKRALEQIMALGRSELVRLAGRGCASGESLVARFAFGLASPREAREAQLHLTTCQTCGALHERLDLWRASVAALVPVPALAQARFGLLERVVHGGVDSLEALKHHAGESANALRGNAADGVSQLKHHAVAAYCRVADPTPLAGARPGVVVAAVAGCIAVGGGATYCAQESVDPLRTLGALVAPASHKRPADRPQPAPRPKPPPAPQAAPPAGVPAPAPAPVPPPPAVQPPPRSAPAPSARDEFEPGTAPTRASTATRAVPLSAPKTEPSGAEEEFGGP
jgi:RNA polymerase sigma factor (sigma-70 family)